MGTTNARMTKGSPRIVERDIMGVRSKIRRKGAPLQQCWDVNLKKMASVKGGTVSKRTVGSKT